MSLKQNKKELPCEGQCEEHCIPNHFKCMDCNEYICGTCVVLLHKSCHKVLPILEALNIMNGENMTKIKVFKTKLEKEGEMLDSKLEHLKTKKEKLHQEIEIVENEEKETQSMKIRNQKLHEETSCYETSLEEASCSEDYDKVDAKVKLFLEENCVDIILPTSSSPIILSIEDARKLTSKDLQEKTFYVMRSDHEEKKYAKVQIKDNLISFNEWENDVEEGSSCVDFLSFIHLRTSVIDTNKFFNEHMKEFHYPMVLPKNRLKSSKIEVKERRVYFHSFKLPEESDFNFEFESLLKILECPSVIPVEVFIKPRISSEEEVVVTTDGGSPRALNFLLLASGIMDDSYQGTRLFNYDSVIKGGFNKNRNFFPGVVIGIRNGGEYERKESKRGDVGGGDADDLYRLSLFRVWKKDSSDRSRTTFGRVKKGMEVIDQIREGKEGDFVKECGLLFNLV